MDLPHLRLQPARPHLTTPTSGARDRLHWSARKFISLFLSASLFLILKITVFDNPPTGPAPEPPAVTAAPSSTASPYPPGQPVTIVFEDSSGREVDWVITVTDPLRTEIPLESGGTTVASVGLEVRADTGEAAFDDLVFQLVDSNEVTIGDPTTCPAALSPLAADGTPDINQHRQGFLCWEINVAHLEIALLRVSAKDTDVDAYFST